MITMAAEAMVIAEVEAATARRRLTMTGTFHFLDADFVDASTGTGAEVSHGRGRYPWASLFYQPT
jgi:hypothetical protein